MVNMVDMVDMIEIGTLILIWTKIKDRDTATGGQTPSQNKGWDSPPTLSDPSPRLWTMSTQKSTQNRKLSEI